MCDTMCSVASRRLVRALIALVALILIAPRALGAASQELKLPQLWKTNLNTFLESTAIVADLKGDGKLEALMAGREELIALDGKGKELWRYRTKGRFMTYPAVLTRKGESSLVFAADNSGQLDCVDGNGKEVWTAKLKGPSMWAAAVVCDLNGDGAAEVIQGDSKGAVQAFDALTGKPVWQAPLKGIVASPAVGDLDGDGKPEVAVTTSAGELTVLKNDGTPLWTRPIGGASQDWSTSSPILFGASDGGARVVAASNDGQVICFDAAGAIRWQHATRGPVASTLSAGDLDQDGRADIFLITQLGVIYRFDESGPGSLGHRHAGQNPGPGGHRGHYG